MQRQFIALLVATLATTVSASLFASGSVPTTRAATRDSFSRSANGRATQASATSSESRIMITDEPYDLGKALFGRKYKLGNPQLTKPNMAEKMQRLSSLRRALPANERAKIDTTLLSKRLTNREMNALEYYLGIRFGKFITVAPSWAKSEPPPKVASAQ